MLTFERTIICVAASRTSPQHDNGSVHPLRTGFPEDPDCPTLVVKQVEEEEQEQKVCGPRNAARDVFVLVYILRYVYYVTYITLRFVNFRTSKESIYVLLFVKFSLRKEIFVNHHLRGPERRRKTLDACARHITHASGLESRTKPGPL